MSAIVTAHVVPGFGNLGVSVWFVVYGVVAGLGLVTVALRSQWVTSRFGAGPDGDDDQDAAKRMPVRGLRQIGLILGGLVGLAIYGTVFAAAVAGDRSVGSNIAPLAVSVGFWISLQGISAVFGDVWAALNPFLSLASVIERLRPARTQRDAPWWLPTLILTSFVWLWLAYDTGTHPRSIAVWLTLDLALMVVGAAMGGRQWVRTADPFAVLFSAIARISPIGVNDAGRLRLRPPLAALGQEAGDQRLGGVLSVLLGSLAFDWLSTTNEWTKDFGRQSHWGYTGVSTAGLVWLIFMAAALWLGAVALANRLDVEEPGAEDSEADDADSADEDAYLGPTTSLALCLAPALVPALVGLSIAHYLSLLVIQLQNLAILASDPLGRGSNLLGTIDWVVNPQPLRPAVAGTIELILIVSGFLASLVLLYDRSIALVGVRRAQRIIWPLAGFMILLSVAGLRVVLAA